MLIHFDVVSVVLVESKAKLVTAKKGVAKAAERMGLGAKTSQLQGASSSGLKLSRFCPEPSSRVFWVLVRARSPI